MVWIFLLALILGLGFGWHVAAMLLVLWLIGFVAFWLFMLFKPVIGDEVGQRSRQPVDLVDHDDVELPGSDVSQQSL